MSFIIQKVIKFLMNQNEDFIDNLSEEDIKLLIQKLDNLRLLENKEFPYLKNDQI